MKFRKLGKTNLNVSVIGIGTWQYGGEWGKQFAQDEVNAILTRGGELGINLIDTAECYGDHLSESLIGNAIQSHRDKWILATKFGHVFHGFMDRTDERSADDAVKQLEASLKALRTDYVDLLQYHSIRNEEFDNEATQNALRKLKQQGKIRHIGNSIAPNDNMHQTSRSTAADVETIQVIYNRLDRKPEATIFPECVKQNLGVLARVPLASGLLSGKYKPGATFSKDEFRGRKDQKEIDEKLKEVEKIARDEVPSGVNMATWALAWCLKNPAVSAVIPGCKDVKQVEANANAADLIDD